MKNFDELYSAAVENGFRVEAFSIAFDRWGDPTINETIIQIEIKEWIWYTWRSYPDTNHTFFEGRYNTNNGVTQKTFRKEYEALKKLGLAK